MCMFGGGGPKKPQAPAPAPPPPAEDEVPSPVIGDGYSSVASLRAKRKGAGGLRVGLKTPKSSGLSIMS